MTAAADRRAAGSDRRRRPVLPGRTLGQLAVRCALAVVPVLAVVTACGPAPVSPLPPLAAGPAAPGSAATPTTPAVTASPPGSATVVASRAAPRNPPPRPTTTTNTTTTTTSTVQPSVSETTSTDPPPCRGVEQYALDLQNTELALIPTMCFAVGSVLRLQGIGPGLVTAEPTTVASQTYEAGVVDIRFIRAGTATVTIPQDDQVHTITVVVID